MQLIQLINYLLSYFLATYFVHLKKLTTVNIIVDVLFLVFFIQVQWAPLYGIMDNGINQLMESNLSRLISSKLLFHI
jgi:hypothetical protein